MRQVKKRHFCQSVQWVSFNDGVCSQCLRIGVECLTVTGQMRYDRRERVDFEHERRKICKLYRGTAILRRRRALEHRVIESLGLL